MSKKTMKRSDFLGALKKISTEKSLTIMTETPAKMLKTDNPLADRNVTKQTTMIVKLNVPYEKAVNDARLEEGVRPTFSAKERTWGVHVKGTPLVEHKGEFYLNCIIESYGDTILFLDGVEMTPHYKRVVEAFTPEKSEGNNRQKIEDKVEPRTFKLSSIIAVHGLDFDDWIWLRG